jgi:hypothetical protein
VWIVGELGAGDEWKSGADADVMLTSPGGATVASTHAHVDPGLRSFRVSFTPSEPLVPGEYTVRLRARGGPSSTASNETLSVALAPPPQASGVLFVRRGPTTGNRETPTADRRFRRSDHIRVELPEPQGSVTARLLDRTGKPLAIPVTTTTREDSDGSRWVTAQLALAPLAAGDYIVELANGSMRTLAAFRIWN